MIGLRHTLVLALGTAACQAPPESSRIDGSCTCPSDGGDGQGPQPSTDARPEAGDEAGRPRGPTVLHVRVFDPVSGNNLPARISLWNKDGMLSFGNQKDPPYCSGMGTSLAEIGTGGALATWNGIALWRGEASIPIGRTWSVPAECGKPKRDDQIPFGTYRLVVTRGAEYEVVDYAAIDLTDDRGVVDVVTPLSRTVDTVGYIAADMHVHTAPGSNDSSVGVADRIKTETSVGIEVLVSADHDFVSDYAGVLKALWPDPDVPPPLAAVPGVEATGSSWHFGAFPVSPDASKAGNGAIPRAELLPLAPQAFLDRLRTLPGPPFLQMNHTRLGFAAYFDSGSCGPWTDRSHLPSCSLDFEAFEVLNGFLGCDTKVHQTLADWYALLGFGVVTTATGNSDTHYTSGILAGFPRTYVRVSGDTPAAFAEDEFMSALRGHHAIATTGPFVTLRVDDRAEAGETVTSTAGKVKVFVRLQTASWVKVDVVRIRRDGVEVASFPVPASASPTVFEATADVAVDADAFITAEAEGATPLEPWIVGDYLSTKNGAGYDCTPTSTAPGMIPFAVTNPVFVDADGDGQWRGKSQPVVFPTPPDLWSPSPFPDGPADCDPRGRVLH